jgi:hypothetical protein
VPRHSDRNSLTNGFSNMVHFAISDLYTETLWLMKCLEQPAKPVFNIYSTETVLQHTSLTIVGGSIIGHLEKKQFLNTEYHLYISVIPQRVVLIVYRLYKYVML